MRIAMIWAMAQNRVIGRGNKLPWHLPNDLKYFKQVTTGKPVIMGRKTYDSIGKPLPNRYNIVISRDSSLNIAGVKTVHSLDAAIELAAAECLVSGNEEVIVMGGAEIYQQCLPRTDRFYVTLVHADVPGDAYFPKVDLNRYTLLAREDFAADGPNPYAYSFCIYQREIN